jgi:hypothetical protein
MAKRPDQRIGGLTQRLDHMVPDVDLSKEENNKVSAELAALSAKLYGLLPDNSLSPFERLERLARVVEGRKPDLSQLQSASKKLEALRARLNDLVPGDASDDKKIDVMAAKLDELVADEQHDWTTFSKLELLGDPRGRVAPAQPSKQGKKKGQKQRGKK